MFTLYRHFDDSGCLLYVGITGNPSKRMSQHSIKADWWPDVATSRYEHFETVDEALALEETAIHTEKPKHNIQHNNPTSGSYVPDSKRRQIWEAKQAELAQGQEAKAARLTAQLLADYLEFSKTVAKDKEGIRSGEFAEWATYQAHDAYDEMTPGQFKQAALSCFGQTINFWSGSANKTVRGWSGNIHDLNLTKAKRALHQVRRYTNAVGSIGRARI